MKYFLSPDSWDRGSYRDVYNEDDIKNLPDDWDADENDCNYIGEFKTKNEAEIEARKNPQWAENMRPI